MHYCAFKIGLMPPPPLFPIHSCILYTYTYILYLYTYNYMPKGHAELVYCMHAWASNYVVHWSWMTLIYNNNNNNNQSHICYVKNGWMDGWMNEWWSSALTWRGWWGVDGVGDVQKWRKVVCFVVMRSTEPGCFRLCSWCLWKALNKEGCMGFVLWHLDLLCKSSWILNDFFTKT